MLKHISRARWTAAGLALLATFSTACNVKEELLSPQQPGVIGPEDVSGAGPTGANALYVGALGRLTNWSAGGGGVNNPNVVIFSDLLADVWKSSDTFSQHNETDQRVIQTNNSVLATAYSDITRSRGYFRTAITALKEFLPDTTYKQGEMYWALGFTETTMSELFCNGIPFGTTEGGVPNYTQPLTNQQGFALALTHLDSAIDLASGAKAGNATAAGGIKNAALITKARTLVDMGKFAEAAALVASVPTSYQYTVSFSQASQSNLIWSLNFQQSSARFAVSDSFDTQGIVKNALPFSSAKDPRVPTSGSPTDKSKLAIDKLTPWVPQQIWTVREAPVVEVSGIDARLIEAEAKLQASDFTGMVGILNTLRGAVQTLGNYKTTAMAALPVPATKDAAINVFFREKAFWQFARGMRLGDMRRLIRQYGRTQDQVFPVGNFHKGGVYGTDVNLPVTDSENTNPFFHGCVDRNA
jgi:hypothetical protein